MTKRKQNPFILKHRRISSLVFAGVINLFAFLLYVNLIQPVPADKNVLGAKTSVSAVGLVVNTPNLGFAIVNSFVDRIMTTLTGTTNIAIYPDTELDLDTRYVFLKKEKILVKDLKINDPDTIHQLISDYDTLQIASLSETQDGVVKTDTLVTPEQIAWLSRLKEATKQYHLIQFGLINGMRASAIELSEKDGKGTFIVHTGNLILFDDAYTFVLKLTKGYEVTFDFRGLVSSPTKTSPNSFFNWSGQKKLVITNLSRFIFISIIIYLVSVALTDWAIERYAILVDPESSS